MLSRSDCSEKLKVLSDQNRLRIVNLLLKKGEKSVSEICSALKLEQSLVSHHLQKLRKVELLVCMRRGLHQVYSIKNAESGDDNTESIDLGCCRLEYY